MSLPFLLRYGATEASDGSGGDCNVTAPFRSSVTTLAVPAAMSCESRFNRRGQHCAAPAQAMSVAIALSLGHPRIVISLFAEVIWVLRAAVVCRLQENDGQRPPTSHRLSW